MAAGTDTGCSDAGHGAAGSSSSGASGAGMSSGIGDWRQEKGSGSFGAFKIVAENDPDFVRICKKQGRAAQQEALDFPEAYNEETAQMLSWFSVEMKKRGMKVEA